MAMSMGNEKVKRRALGVYNPPSQYNTSSKSLSTIVADESTAQGPLQQVQMMKKKNKLRRPSPGLNPADPY